MRQARPATLVLPFLLLACGGETDGGVRVPVKVMTRNLYLGADLEPPLRATTREELSAKSAAFWATVRASDIPARARLLAAEIAAASPDLVGLQECELFRTQTPSDFDYAASVKNAATVEFDFLPLLLDELTARGLTYVPAVVNTLSDVELPVLDAPTPFDLRMTDRDVILARAGLVTANPRAKPFDTHIEITIGGATGVPVSLLRGWSALDVTTAGVTFTFLNTHLEVGAGPALVFQESQANELVGVVDKIPGQLVLVGDLNSPADGTGSRSYSFITKKLSDAWTALRPTDPGFTCCAGDLTVAAYPGDQRIDLVLTRAPVRSLDIALEGLTARTAAGQFASDHAGVVATVGVKP